MQALAVALTLVVMIVNGPANFWWGVFVISHTRAALRTKSPSGSIGLASGNPDSPEVFSPHHHNSGQMSRLVYIAIPKIVLCCPAWVLGGVECVSRKISRS